MSDILDRLRAYSSRRHPEDAVDLAAEATAGDQIDGDRCCCPIMEEAADEIERLREDCDSHIARIFGLRRDNDELTKRVNELTRHLVIITSDCWPYLHQHCTIKSVKQNWEKARAALKGDE